MENKAPKDVRRYLRYDLLDYVLAYPKNAPGGIRSIIADVGLGGLALRSHEPLTVGSEVNIIIGQGANASLMIKGVVRHSDLNGESNLYATGVQFRPENHDQRIAIARYVNEVFQRRCDASSTTYFS